VSQRELAKYAENDEEDYDDIFDEKPSLGLFFLQERLGLIDRLNKETILTAHQAVQLVLAFRSR